MKISSNLTIMITHRVGESQHQEEMFTILVAFNTMTLCWSEWRKAITIRINADMSDRASLHVLHLAQWVSMVM